MFRECPYCGAHLDPCEVCDCKEKAAPGGRNPEAAMVNETTIIITEKKQNVKEV